MAPSPAAKVDKMEETTPPPPKDSSNGLSSIVEIAPRGDLVLHIQHGTAKSDTVHRFRVSSDTLKSSSKYFASLGRFGEGEKIQKTHALLRRQYKDLADAPSDELPEVHIEDVGRVSVKSPGALLKDFLLVLHGQELPVSPPVANLANLAIVADRFDALEAVRAYMQRKKIIRLLDGKTTPKVESTLSEEKIRQRLLVSILLDYGPWLEKYSARLIIKGWVGKQAQESDALWWDLPSRLEEELLVRRDYILETIQSVQAHFIRLYTSRERQCRLGYDSSQQCDSFQLGEVIRFFTRIGTLRIQGTLLDATEPPAPYEGDLHNLIDTFRQTGEYQIDKNHNHCGIKTRITPILDLLTERLHYIGVCLECWVNDRMDHGWMEAKRPLLWKKQSLRLRNVGHRELHANVKALFTASERDWSA